MRASLARVYHSEGETAYQASPTEDTFLPQSTRWTDRLGRNVAANGLL